MSRRAARDCAFKLIYQTPFHANSAWQDAFDVFISSGGGEKLDENDLDYIKQTLCNCFDNVEAIDEKIRAMLKNWTLERISKVNLAILRLSVSEMTYGGIPYQISINEAVELAKKYSDDDAPSFINGVLADIIK